MKKMISSVLLVLCAGLAVCSVSADWRIVEVKNQTPVAYDIYLGDTDYEGGIRFDAAQKLGRVEPQTVFSLPSTLIANKKSTKYNFMLLQPAKSVAGKSRTIRVYFAPNQTGTINPTTKKTGYTIQAVTAATAATNYLQHFSAKSITATFYPPKLTNAAIGVLIQANGLPSFYGVKRFGFTTDVDITQRSTEYQ